jgi:folate-binding protein YgfZ
MSEGYEALLHGAAWLNLSSRGRTTVRGRDRARFLHNVTSNEVKKMAPGQGCYAFLLSPQGRIQADLCLFSFEDRFLIGTEPELREKVSQHMRRYIVADQVELEDVTAATASIGLEGPGAGAILAAAGAPAAPGAPYAHVPWGEATVAAVTVTGQPGFRIFCAATAMEALVRQLEAAGAKSADAADARVVRIENGKPRYGEDIGETTLVQETRQMHAVSFTKGCYIGQEIVERVRARGHVNKVLVRLELGSAEPPPSGAKLAADGAEAGEVTSAVYSPRYASAVALAYVRTPLAEPGTELKADGVTAKVAG